MLALLVQYSKLTREEAATISEELTHSIKPARYEDAERLITRILEDLKK
jgi:polyhydroxyalkanoate synthesis regulator phasin